LRDLTQSLIDAIQGEVGAISRDPARFFTLLSGQRISVDAEGYLYLFRALIPIKIIPESPIVFVRTNHQDRVNGTWISQDDFGVLILLERECGPTITKGKVAADLTFILKALSQRLSEPLSERPVLDIFAESPAAQLFSRDLFSETLAQLDTLGIRRNESQLSAIANCLKNKIHFVWGPPGTGKTSTLAQTCRVLADQDEKTIVIAHANVAADVAAVQIAHACSNTTYLSGRKVLRIGVSQLASAKECDVINVRSALRCVYPNLIAQLVRAEQERAAIIAELATSSSTAALALNQELTLCREQIQSLKQQVRNAESKLISDAKILVATASKFVIDERLWNFAPHNIIVDEVSMLGFPFVFAATNQATKRILLFGDFRQLPPVCVSEERPVTEWLARDAFDIVGIKASINKGLNDPRVTLLDTQYRMTKDIGEIVSKFVYDNKLKTDEQSSLNAKNLPKVRPAEQSSIVVIDTSTAFSACIRERKRGSYSRVNPLQALISLSLANTMIEDGAKKVGILSPYKAQAQLSHLLIRESKMDNQIEAATIHRFQGSELDTVILDLADALPQSRASELTGSDTETASRLLNVAISRAKGKLVVLVDCAFLRTYHSGISPAVKLLSLLKQFPSMEFNPSECTLAGLRWFSNWNDAQPSLFSQTKAELPLYMNVPSTFSTSAQLNRLLSGYSARDEQKIRNNDKFLLIRSSVNLLLGGHSPEGPIALAGQNLIEALEHAIIGDDFKSHK
jgi:hypothetical protein